MNENKIAAISRRRAQSMGLLSSLESARAIYRQIGHSASLDTGRIPEACFEWSCHLMQDAETMLWEVSAIERAARGVYHVAPGPV